MEPVFAALAVYVVIDERLTLCGYLGAGMILSRMLLAELSPCFFQTQPPAAAFQHSFCRS